MNYHLKTARILANLLDNKYHLGKFRFGIDPLLGLIPVAGDLFTTILSFYIVWIAAEMKVPQSQIAVMIKNILIDFFLDFIPVVGQVADFVFKSNSKNLEILEKYASSKANIVEGEAY